MALFKKQRGVWYIQPIHLGNKSFNTIDSLYRYVEYLKDEFYRSGSKQPIPQNFNKFLADFAVFRNKVQDKGDGVYTIHGKEFELWYFYIDEDFSLKMAFKSETRMVEVELI